MKAELATLLQDAPPGLEVVYPLDTEPFILLSIEEVVKTLLEAVVLVFAVMYIFLQNFRATLIPTIAVPVVLLGTFGVLSAFGYSINTLTMLAMVLAVGLLVDDAIVVVENVSRVMEEEHLSPRDATRKSMTEISGALVGIAMVLSAVFLPMAFLGGSTGVIYRQFSVTIVSAMALSVLVALILTPALCATLLKPVNENTRPKRGLFALFNNGFDWVNRRYTSIVGRMIGGTAVSLILFVVIAVGMGVLFTRLPGGFLPEEDQALLFGQVTLPPNSTAEQTADVNRRVTDYLMQNETKAVKSVLSVVGFNFAGQAQSSGFLVISLLPWDKRDASQSAEAVAGRAMGHFAHDPAAQVFVVSPPAVIELGNATGFDMELLDRANLGHAALLRARNQLLGAAAGESTLAQVRPNGLNDTAQYQLQIDREKANAAGVSVADLNTLIEGAFGSIYVNQFQRDGRVKQVYVQGDAAYRMLPDQLGQWYLRNAAGGLMPMSAVMTGKWLVGPAKVESYNGDTSYEILGAPGPGGSTGASLKTMERLAAKLPKGIGYAWTGLSFEEVQAGSQTAELYAVSGIVILFCLAALYESWAIPFAVMLVVPLGVIGAVLATLLRGLDNDVYFQVGLLTTVGLAVKNAILIVEFAKANYEAGQSLLDAALHAAQERLRPILMTSLAFVFGVFPLAIASGAGAASRAAIGTAVVGGMVSATILAIFFVPVFFTSVLRLFHVKPHTDPDQRTDAPAGNDETRGQAA